MVFPEFRRFGFDPLAEMRRMQNDMNRLLSDFTTARAPDFPALNVWLGPNSVVVTAELPGVSGENINLSLQEDMLTLQGERSLAASEPGVTLWHRRERSSGRFSRTIQLPFRVDPDTVQARFHNGILEIELTRPAEEQPKRIEVRSA